MGDAEGVTGNNAGFVLERTFEESYRNLNAQFAEDLVSHIPKEVRAKVFHSLRTALGLHSADYHVSELCEDEGGMVDSPASLLSSCVSILVKNLNLNFARQLFEVCGYKTYDDDDNRGCDFTIYTNSYVRPDEVWRRFNMLIEAWKRIESDDGV
ncbi:hypothetical protein HOF67_01365 [Candidatus Peregrinibacteria bacterium]|nr:hypothetical protein [Candidatus Peregrinibacteria bacterium]